MLWKYTINLECYKTLLLVVFLPQYVDIIVICIRPIMNIKHLYIFVSK